MSRKNIILQRIVEIYANDIPSEWFLPQVEQFGINWRLFDYQVKAIEYISKALYLYYSRGLDRYYEYYQKEGLSSDLEEKLSVKKEDENFRILSEYYQVEDGKISFKGFLNRASFWMATGSGKTLVMVKLIELLHHLMKKRLIPPKDILILAPKDEILNQIKKHIDTYNQNAVIQIEMIRELAEKALNRQLFINEVVSAKYLNMIIPDGKPLTFELSFKAVENGFSINSIIKNNDRVSSKVKMKVSIV